MNILARDWALIFPRFDAILLAMPQGPGSAETGSGGVTRTGVEPSSAGDAHHKSDSMWRPGVGIPLLFLVLAATLFARNIAGLRPVIPYGLMNGFHPWKAEATDVPVQENPELYDQVFQFYAWWDLIKDEISAGRLPLWNPYSFCGSPLLANGQSGIFFPLNMLNWILSLNLASLLLAISRLFVAAIFAYGFLRQLELRRSSAVFGAITLAFSRNIIVWLGFPAGSAAILLPAAFWASERLIRDTRMGNVLIAALVLGAQFLAGQPQSSLVTLICVSTYLMIRLLRDGRPLSKRLQVMLLFGAAWGLALLLAAVQLLPMMEYLRESAAMPLRTQFNIKAYPWYEVVSFVLPDFFGTPYHHNYWGFANLVGTSCYLGVGPLLLALLSLRRALRSGTVQTFWIIALGCIGMVYRLPILGRIASLPILVGVDTNKYLAAIVFSLSVCAACELDLVLRQDLRRAIRWLFVWAAVLFAVVLLHVVAFRQFISAMRLWSYEIWNLAIFTVIMSACLSLLLVARLKTLKPELVAVGLIALTFWDLFIFGHSVNATSEKAGIPRQPDCIRELQTGSAEYRVLGTQRVLPANSSIFYGLSDVRGYDAITPARYYEFMSRVDRGYADFSATLHPAEANSIDRSTLFKRELAQLLRVGGPPLRRLLEKTYYWNSDLEGLLGTSALDAMGVRYILAPPGTRSLPSGNFRLICEGQVAVFENSGALPRCYLRDRFSVMNDAQALELVGSPNFDFDHDLVLSHVTEAGPLQAKFSSPDRNSLQGSQATIVNHDPERVEVKVEARGPVVLVLSDLFYPGWEAALDSQAVPVFAANYAFRAIVIPQAGTHSVEFRYRPGSFLLGARISLSAVALCVVFGVFACFHRRTVP